MRRLVRIEFLMALIGNLLLPSRLLCENYLSDFHQRFRLKPRLIHHVINLDESRQCARDRPVASCLMQPIAIPTREVEHNIAGLRYLHNMLACTKI